MPRKKTMGRAANGNGTIRKKTVTKNGTEYTYWEARCTVGYDPGTGKQLQKSITGKTQKEAAQKLKQMSLDVDNGTYQEPSKMTVGEWLDIWAGDYMGDKKYSTVKTYKAQIETHIKPGLGAVKLSQLAPHMIQKFYNDLLAGGQSVPKRDKAGKVVKKNGKTVYESAPMSAKTVRNVHGVLTKALSTAFSIGYLRMNPAERVTLPRVERKELQPLTDNQVKEFLRVSALDPCGTVLKVILFTALRESEALGLTWDCIDFQAGTVKICKQLQKRRLADGETVFAPLKNDRIRVLKPAPFVMELLARQWKDQAAQRLQAGDRWQSWQNQEDRKTALAFTTPEGNDISPTSIRYHFKKLVTEIGASSCRVHDLRHPNVKPKTKNFYSLLRINGQASGHIVAYFLSASHPAKLHDRLEFVVMIVIQKEEIFFDGSALS